MSDKDNPYSAPDTGHVWDGNLRELSNPPPRWWTITFHASWIFVVVYALLFPMIPLIDTHTKGILGWTSIQRLKETTAQVEAIRAPFEERIKGMDAAAIAADPELRNYVTASAKVLFGDNCAPCHGAGGQGNPGYPILADDDWLFGGTLAAIEQSVVGGRRGMMPAQSRTLSAEEIDQLVRYVAGLASGSEDPAGKALFMGKGACFACHGPDGKGNPLLGAPNLTDVIWRFGGDEEAIRHTITHGVNDPSAPETRPAVMPAFGGKLSSTEIKKLAVYVHQLGGGQ